MNLTIQESRSGTMRVEISKNVAPNLCLVLISIGIHGIGRLVIIIIILVQDFADNDIFCCMHFATINSMISV